MRAVDREDRGTREGRTVRENGSIVVLAALAVMVLTAALTHFSAILLLPEVASKDAVSRLAAHLTPNEMTVLAPNRPGAEPIPFADPAIVQAACLFDLTKAPLRVRAKTVEGRLLTLSFRAADGRIFYSMTDRAALHDTIDIRLVTADQLKVIEAGDNEDDALPSELRLQAPTPKGLLLASALVARPSEAQDAEARLKAVSCAPEPIAVANAARDR